MLQPSVAQHRVSLSPVFSVPSFLVNTGQMLDGVNVHPLFVILTALTYVVCDWLKREFITIQLRIYNECIFT